MGIEGKWGESVITLEDEKKVNLPKGIVPDGLGMLPGEKKVKVTMGARPDGHGIVLSENPYVILVKFPDDRDYVGTLINNNQIQWCGLGGLTANNVWNR